MTRGRVLVKGERVRLTPGGPIYVVDRVNSCAAYVHRVYEPPIVKVWEDPHTHETKRILVGRGPSEPGISPESFVYRVDEEDGTAPALGECRSDES